MNKRNWRVLYLLNEYLPALQLITQSTLSFRKQAGKWHWSFSMTLCYRFLTGLPRADSINCLLFYLHFKANLAGVPRRVSWVCKGADCRVIFFPLSVVVIKLPGFLFLTSAFWHLGFLWHQHNQIRSTVWSYNNITAFVNQFRHQP